MRGSFVVGPAPAIVARKSGIGGGIDDNIENESSDCGAWHKVG